MFYRVKISLFSFLAFAFLAGSLDVANSQTRVSVGVTETIETHNPYGDSVSLLYGIFSEITGPFCTYNYTKGDFEGRLAEKWKSENPTAWLFYLNKNYKFNDGSPVTADDVVHSIMTRVIKDPQSKQKASVAPSVVNAEAVDKFTVRISTDKPTAPLLSFFCDRLIITSKAAFDKYGRDVADREHMMGGGPYQLKELIPGQRLLSEDVNCENAMALGHGRIRRQVVVPCASSLPDVWAVRRPSAVIVWCSERPLGHSRPTFTGWAKSPLTLTAAPSRTPISMPQPTEQ